MIVEEEDYLEHYGILRRSGRYPWGSGGNVATRSRSFIDWLRSLRNDGMSEKDIARGVGLSMNELRAVNTIALNRSRAADIAFAQRLKDKGWSNVAIGTRMGVNESQVRALLAPGAKDKNDMLMATSDKLKERVSEVTYLDIGTGTEHWVGVSSTKLNAAVQILKAEGYEVHSLYMPQLGTNKDTRYKILVPPGVSRKDVFVNRDKIQQMAIMTEDGGRTWFGLHPPLGVDSKRIAINYAEDGGDKADGVILLRPGVEDISLGGSNYAQVRIQVDDSHYLKGMAMYSSDLPDGVDILFNTNKSKLDAPDKLDVMKKLKTDDSGNIDPDNPFGSQIKIGGQQVERLPDGTERVKSAINIVNEEGDWSEWSQKLSSQMLSKQSTSLAKEQLDKTFDAKQKEFDEIMALTNPVVKKKMLETFADDADSSAVHLKAVSMKNTAQHVILPIDSLPDTQVYAPNYANGERVVLIRHPHGGTFEIPDLIVNNNNPEAKKALGQSRDAIGINANVAQRLSGADFDGDTVLVIPNSPRSGKITVTKALEDLKDFDTGSYAPYDGMKTIDGGTYNAKTKSVDYGDRKPSDKTKQQQMGQVSNLITDMTIKGASPEEIARAVRHSMVVIDAEKHHLNYKQSAKDNGISSLKEKYQGGPRAGASTLISRAGSVERVPDRKPRSAAEGGPIDRETGRRVFTETGRTVRDRDGNVIPKTFKSQKLAETDDAHTLSSGTPIERIYADHSNRLKGLANQARKNALETPPSTYSKSSRIAYQKEVDSLKSKLALAQRNAPLERQAQAVGNMIYRAKLDSNRNMDEDEKKKVKDQALREARRRTGASKDIIQIEPREWDAIQAGAVSPSMLKSILNNADIDEVKKLATPTVKPVITQAKLSRAQSMFASGATRAEVARALGVPLGTLDDALYGS